MSSNFRQQLETYLKNVIVPGGSVLDVGGLQKPIEGRASFVDVDKYKIFDIIGEMDGRKADYVGDISRSLDYMNNFDELEGQFNTVFCLEVMEYVFDPLTALKNLRGFMSINGTLYISFPFLYPIHPPEGTDLLRYTLDGVDTLLREAGFNTFEITPRLAGPGKQALHHFYELEGTRPRRDDTSLLDHIGYVVKATRTY